MKKITGFGVVEELEAMKHLVTAVSIYRIREEIILRGVHNKFLSTPPMYGQGDEEHMQP